MAWMTRAELRGPVGTFDEVSATTLPPGASATAVIGGTPANRVVTFGIPRGLQGLPGVNAVANDSATATYINTPGSATEAALSGHIAAQSARFVSHGWDGATPRGNSIGNVIWVGWVEPLNKIEGQDLWVQPLTGPEPDFLLGPGIAPSALWRASDIAEPLGAITDWPASVGGFDLSGSATLAEDSNGQRYVEFDGVDDQMVSAALGGQWRYVVAVARLVGPTANADAIIVGTAGAGRGPKILVNTGLDPDQFAARSTEWLNGPSVDAGWHHHRVNFAGAPDGRYVVDGELATGGTGVYSVYDGLSLGAQAGGSFTHVQIKAVAAYSTGFGITEPMFDLLEKQSMLHYGIGG